jgi:hypothetical protein
VRGTSIVCICACAASHDPTSAAKTGKRFNVVASQTDEGAITVAKMLQRVDGDRAAWRVRIIGATLAITHPLGSSLHLVESQSQQACGTTLKTAGAI